MSERDMTATAVTLSGVIAALVMLALTAQLLAA
jgi:hypothetical protein